MRGGVLQCACVSRGQARGVVGGARWWGISPRHGIDGDCAAVSVRPSGESRAHGVMRTQVLLRVGLGS